MYVTIFTVSGHGPFPLDMLRFDSAYPGDDESVQTIRRSYMEDETLWMRRPFRVTLARRTDTRGSAEPTIERWRSFGCNITVVRTSKI